MKSLAFITLLFSLSTVAKDRAANPSGTVEKVLEAFGLEKPAPGKAAAWRFHGNRKDSGGAYEGEPYYCNVDVVLIPAEISKSIPANTFPGQGLWVREQYERALSDRAQFYFVGPGSKHLVVSKKGNFSIEGPKHQKATQFYPGNAKGTALRFPLESRMYVKKTKGGHAVSVGREDRPCEVTSVERVQIEDARDLSWNSLVEAHVEDSSAVYQGSEPSRRKASQVEAIQQSHSPSHENE